MEHGTLEIKLIPNETLKATGAETTQFFFQPNLEQQGGPLSKIASGGELSRVSLAIQAVAATRLATPTLVFDEVDVGIGGKTAAKVGELLTELACNSQVLVVTHQPQVAGQADQHLHVQKQSDSDVTISKHTCSITSSVSTKSWGMLRQAKCRQHSLSGGYEITLRGYPPTSD